MLQKGMDAIDKSFAQNITYGVEAIFKVSDGISVQHPLEGYVCISL